jgi:hypothetical protein
LRDHGDAGHFFFENEGEVPDEENIIEGGSAMTLMVTGASPCSYVRPTTHRRRASAINLSVRTFPARKKACLGVVDRLYRGQTNFHPLSNLPTCPRHRNPKRIPDFIAVRFLK